MASEKELQDRANDAVSQLPYLYFNCTEPLTKYEVEMLEDCVAMLKSKTSA